MSPTHNFFLLNVTNGEFRIYKYTFDDFQTFVKCISRPIREGGGGWNGQSGEKGGEELTNERARHLGTREREKKEGGEGGL